MYGQTTVKTRSLHACLYVQYKSLRSGESEQLLSPVRQLASPRWSLLNACITRLCHNQTVDAGENANRVSPHVLPPRYSYRGFTFRRANHFDLYLGQHAIVSIFSRREEAG